MSKCFVFSYGSLMLKREVERTLNRSLFDDDIFPVRLKEHQRSWSAIRNNLDSDHKWLVDRQTGVPPKFVAYLNLAFDEKSVVDGVLFLIDEEDLQGFDRRELGYKRIEISSLIESDRQINCPVFTYMDQSEEYLTDDVFVSFHYLNLVRSTCVKLEPISPGISQNYLDFTSMPNAILADLDVVYFNSDYTQLFELRLDRNPSKIQLAFFHKNNNKLDVHQDLIAALSSQGVEDMCLHDWRKRFFLACLTSNHDLEHYQKDSSFLVKAMAQSRLLDMDMKHVIRTCLLSDHVEGEIG